MRGFALASVVFLAVCATAVDDLPRGPHGEPEFLPAPAWAFDGELVGVLRDREGRPLAHVFLQAVLADRPAHKSVGRSMSSKRFASRWGLPSSGTGCTDAGGGFRLVGLQPGKYDIHVMSPEFPLAWPPITDSPVSTGDEGLELVADSNHVWRQRYFYDAVPAKGPGGTLSVTVRFPDGRPYDTDNQVRVIRSSDSSAVRWSERHHMTPWYRTSLSVGRYVVRASANESVPSCGVGWKPSLSRFGSVEEECVIEEGAETHLDLVLVRGGRVRLALPFRGRCRDPLLACALAVPEPMGANEFHAALEGDSVGTARLIDVDGRPTDLVFYAPRINLTYRRKEILPGTACLSHTIVRPGVYRLEVSLPGYTAPSPRVVIHANRISEVRIPLREAR